MRINSKYLRKPYSTGFKFKLKNKDGKRSIELVLLQSANICISVPFTSWSGVLPTLERIQAQL